MVDRIKKFIERYGLFFPLAIVLCMILFLLIVFCFYDITAAWLLSKHPDTDSTRMDVLYKIALFFAGVLTFFLAAWRANSHDLQARISAQGYITDRFIKVTEQLGHEKIEVRMGAIFSLWRIGADSEQISDKKAILDMLCAYICDKIKRPEEDPEETPWWDDSFADLMYAPYPPLRAKDDTKIALQCILCDNENFAIPKDYRVSLHGCDLSSYVFKAPSLERIYFEYSLLLGCKISDTSIYDTNFEYCEMNYMTIKNVIFNKTIIHADFCNANLEHVKFIGTHFRKCDFSKSHLCDVELISGNIRTIIFSKQTLENAKIFNIKGNEEEGMKSRIDFSIMKIKNAIFKNIAAIRFDMYKVSIHDTEFHNVDFTGCECRNVTCENVQFKHCYYLEAGYRHPVTREYFDDDAFEGAIFEV